MKTQASKPCCAACAATALARLPVEEHPTVWKPKRRAAARAVATTRSLKEREGKQTASFLRKRFLTPPRLAGFPEATRGGPPTGVGGRKPSGSGSRPAEAH